MSTYFTYSGEKTRYGSFPLGGIGAGSIGLGSDGRLKDWEIFNRPAKGSLNGFSHFAIRATRDEEVLDVRTLHGPYSGNAAGEVAGTMFNTFGFGPRRETMAGFPWFAETSLVGPYPLAKLRFMDLGFPGDVSLNAFSPFVPMDSRVSSLPAAFFEFEVVNTTNQPIDYALIGCMGFPFKDTTVTVDHSNGISVIGTAGADAASPNYGQICLATDHPDTSFQRNLFRGSWFDTMEVYWQDISTSDKLTDRFYDANDESRTDSPLANSEHALAASHFTLAPGEAKTIRYLISWYIPNSEKYWESHHGLAVENPEKPSNVWKNYYATEWADVTAVTSEAFDIWDSALTRTKRFRDILVETTAPDSVIDAVASNLSIVKTATALRLENGTFFGWEGCHPSEGCCEGSCTHVWNYQQVLPFLFPDLERSMREADFQYNQFADTGGMTFRLSLPLGVGIGTSRPCVDGQFGNVLKAYRDWKLQGDQNWLEGIWPSVKGAIEYTWHSENYDRWDPEKSGVLTGRQHHTLDMELFGPSSWLNGFYLAALAAGAEMAKAVGDDEAAVEYAEILEKGKKYTESELFNGSYFIQKVDLGDKEMLLTFDTKEGATGHFDRGILTNYWSEDHGEIKYQVQDGCEIDQVLAQWHTRLYGLDDVFDCDQFASAVNAIYENNFKSRLGDTVNPCRIFGMGDEAGTVMCAWPEGTPRPKIPVPYSQETMHGFEYAFGTQLMMVGEYKKGFEVFKSVRDRYRGDNRNPWNEIECGSNYARSMSSYAALVVMAGFAFDSVARTMGFDPKGQVDGVFRSLWSNGLAWGSVEVSEGAVTLTVDGGELELSSLKIGSQEFDAIKLVNAGAAMVSSNNAVIRSGETLNLNSSNISLPGQSFA